MIDTYSYTIKIYYFICAYYVEQLKLYVLCSQLTYTEYPNGIALVANGFIIKNHYLLRLQFCIIIGTTRPHHGAIMTAFTESLYSNLHLNTLYASAAIASSSSSSFRLPNFRYNHSYYQNIIVYTVLRMDNGGGCDVR